MKPLRPRLLLTEIELCVWLGHAKPGDQIEYHRGFLVVDTDTRQVNLSERDRRELVQLGRRAYWAAEIGRAHLLQRRHGPGDYSYLLVARPHPKTASVSLSQLLLAELA